MLNHVYVIAEIGVNHNGLIDEARRLIDIAAEAGADAVKFQTFKADQIVTQTTEKAAYQKHANGDDSQYNMLKNLELSDGEHIELLHYAESQNIDFLSSPFGIENLHFLTNTLKLKTIKIASGELSNAPLLYHTGLLGANVILSTGMADLASIQHALNILDAGYQNIATDKIAEHICSDYASLHKKVRLLQCTSMYPCPNDSAHLAAISTLKNHFKLQVGFSDHTTSIHAGGIATAAGATLIEKHITRDKNSDGPDHQASLSPTELQDYVQHIRLAQSLLGNAEKKPEPQAREVAKVAEKYIVALKPIKAGEPFTTQNIVTTRNGGKGVHASHYYELINTRASNSYDESAAITEPIGNT